MICNSFSADLIQYGSTVRKLVCSVGCLRKYFKLNNLSSCSLWGQAVSARVYSRVVEGRVAGNWLSFPDSQVSLAIFIAYSEAPHCLTFDIVCDFTSCKFVTLFLSTSLLFHSISILCSQEKVKSYGNQVNSQFGLDSVCLHQGKEKICLNQ